MYHLGSFVNDKSGLFLALSYPLSHLNDFFNYTFKHSVTKVLFPLPYFGDLIYAVDKLTESHIFHILLKAF